MPTSFVTHTNLKELKKKKELRTPGGGGGGTREQLGPRLADGGGTNGTMKPRVQRARTWYSRQAAKPGNEHPKHVDPLREVYDFCLQKKNTKGKLARRTSQVLWPRCPGAKKRGHKSPGSKKNPSKKKKGGGKGDVGEPQIHLHKEQVENVYQKGGVGWEETMSSSRPREL